jgi:hypothetical protein
MRRGREDEKMESRNGEKVGALGALGARPCEAVCKRGFCIEEASLEVFR